MAYQNKKKTAEITDLNGDVYIIDFDSMMEYPKNNPGDSVRVLRRDKMHGKYIQFVFMLQQNFLFSVM